MSRRRAVVTTSGTSRARSARVRERSRQRTTSRSASPPAERRTRRRLGPFTKAVVALGLAASGVLLGGQWVLHSSLLRVRHVVLVGAHHESTAQLLAASELASGPAMIDVSAGLLDQRFRGFAWIKDVSVVKHWPNSLVVNVVERTPVAVAFDARHELRYVDAQGHDLGVAPLHVNLPTLVYLHATNPTWPYLRAGHSAAVVASQLPRAFASQVAQITEDALGVVTIKLTTPVSFIVGPPTNLTAKFVSIASVIAHSTLAPGDVIDVTVPGALAVTGPAPK